MQNKGAIKFFAIAFVLVCAFQLSFTFFTRSVENKAKDYAVNAIAQDQALKLSKGNAIIQNLLLDSIANVRERYFLDRMSNEVIYNLLIRKYTYKD